MGNAHKWDGRKKEIASLRPLRRSISVQRPFFKKPLVIRHGFVSVSQ
jgi:hypothetical protein